MSISAMAGMKITVIAQPKLALESIVSGSITYWAYEQRLIIPK